MINYDLTIRMKIFRLKCEVKGLLKLGVLASGRGTNLQSIIDHIKEGKLNADVKVIISDNRDSGALQRAEKEGISHYFINPEDFSSRKDYEKALINKLKEYEVELVVLAGFMRILSPYFINKYRQQIMNIHPSLLPAFRGLNAHQQALEYGVKVSGCTVHFVDEGMDTGPIILQEVVPVKVEDTVETLSQRILEKEHEIYPEAIQLYEEGKHNKFLLDNE